MIGLMIEDCWRGPMKVHFCDVMTGRVIKEDRSSYEEEQDP
jgi:hypothetical protein